MIVSGNLGHPGLARHQYQLIAQTAFYCAAERHLKNSKTITVWSAGHEPTTYYVNDDQEGMPFVNAEKILTIRKD